MDFNPGITAIVGPNGSGKSNVADAVRWVLGEQSPKTLRGGKMQDVIFSGTQVRKALGLAEVSLFIDNSNGVLPINNPEVIVTRRVLRSGENEYFINKSQTRLKDVADLFIDTGLGKEGYSIIGQGRIDEILSIHSGERRQVFEQAAGIGKYKMRKEEAEVKLQKTKDNLIRIEDIIYEIEQQLTHLKSQSDRALEFNMMKQDLKVAEINKFMRLYKRCVEKLDQLNIQSKSQAKDLDVWYSRLSVDECVLRERKQRLSDGLKETEAVKDDRNEKIALQERLNGKKDLILDKLKRLSEENDLLQGEAAKDNIILSERQLNISKSNEMLLSKESLINEKRMILGEIENKLYYIANQSIIDFKSVEQHKRAITGLSDKISDLKASLAKHETIYDRLTSEKTELNNRSIVKIESHKTLLECINALSREIDAKTEDLYSLKTKRVADESAVSAQNKAIQECEHSINNIKQRIEAKKSRLDILESMQANFEGYGLGVKNILKAKNQSKLQDLKVCGVVADLIEVDKEYRGAIEAALGSSMQHVITENEEDAKGIIEFLRKNEFGRATFLPITSVKSKLLSRIESDALILGGSLGVASCIINFEEKYRGIFENLLGRTVITETIEQAIYMAKRYGYSFRIVTIKADVINPGGSIAGGNSIRKSNTIIGRKQEIDELRVEFYDLQKILTEKKLILANLSKELNAKKADYKSITDKTRESEIHLAIIKQRHESVLSDNDRIKIEIKALDEKKAKLDNDLKENSSVLKSLTDNLLILEKSKINILSETQKFEAEIESVSVLKDDLEKQIVCLKNGISSFECETSGLNERIKYLTVDIKRYVEINEKRRQKIHENMLAKSELEEKATLIELEARELAASIDLSNNYIAQKEDEKRNLDKHLIAIESSIEESRQFISQIKDLQHKTELKISRFEAELDHLAQGIWDEYQISYGNAMDYLDISLDLDLIEINILSLKKRIDDLGGVNLNSIDDYKKLKIRCDLLCAQKQDLLEAKRNLDQVIEEMTASMRKEFCAEFEIINCYFSTVFSKLFGGGEARLVLEDESRPLDCGIEIEAQPPGKKLQSLSLLSGGEKALTASAILFAILKRKPALFCVLDEIDAVLDESNLYNLGGFLREFSSSTQFIVITHRKVTMEMCDALYGVVMEEKGISKLVSVKLEGIAV